jgi:hypothetical protein
MLRPPPSKGCWSEGQIALEGALLCLDCELIVTGIFNCPRGGGEVVRLLAVWLSRPPAAEPATACVA